MNHSSRSNAKKDSIKKDISIEELVQKLSSSVSYLMEKGIKCLACGEPIWGTLESAAREKGFNDSEIARFVEELNSIGNK
jgi:methionine synthase II (cobalamin-independent)